MTDNNPAADKRIVNELEFGSRTTKRVTWEAWEFSIEGPHLVRVTNASYGFEKADHSYLVGIEDRDGLLVPAECECPADVHREPDCKHKVALATIGGPLVLEAAVECPTPRVDATETPEKQLRTDGGVITDEATDDGQPLNASEHTDCDCTDGSDNFPCWPCYRNGRKELPE